MHTYRHKDFIKRNYDCTNVVFCQTSGQPPVVKRTRFVGNENIEEDYYPWVLCDESEIESRKCVQLHTIDEVKYFGYM